MARELHAIRALNYEYYSSAGSPATVVGAIFDFGQHAQKFCRPTIAALPRVAPGWYFCQARCLDSRRFLGARPGVAGRIYDPAGNCHGKSTSFQRRRARTENVICRENPSVADVLSATVDVYFFEDWALRRPCW